MAGKERNHIFAGLDFDGIHIIRRYNPCANNGIFQGFP
jgi:hypothetical protein